MGKINWDDGHVSEYDMIAEVNEGNYQNPIVKAAPEVLEKIEEEAAFELNNEESNVVYNARLRLEQAKLYEMLINHNIFEGVDADPNAIRRVQNELKEYIVERLEILLGLKTSKVRAVQTEQIEVELPFNDVEVDFLKQLSHKGTNGASTKVTEPTKVNAGLKPISSNRVNKGLKTLTKTPTEQDIEQDVEPLRTEPKQKPIRQNRDVKIQNKVKKGINTRELTDKEAEEIAKQDLAAMEARGKWSKMNAKQKAQEIARVNQKHAVHNKTNNKMPIPSTDQLTAHYMTQAASRNNTSDIARMNEIVSSVLIRKKTEQ